MRLCGFCRLAALVVLHGVAGARRRGGLAVVMAAAEHGHITKVKLLLANGAQVGMKDKLGRAALQYARPPRNGHDDEFPQCYETLSSDTLKPTNDCAGTRKLLKQAASK